MSNVDYRPWLTEDFGLLPEQNTSSFNNVVYLVELLVGKKLTGTLDKDDMDVFNSHMDHTNDSNGLYLPKNSHDNLSMKMFGSMILGTNHYKGMSLYNACKGANFHPRDVVLYTLAIGSKPLQMLARPFLIIPSVSMIMAALSAGKVRPKLESGRWKLWFKKKELISVTKTRDGWIKRYFFPKEGTYYEVRLHQNDGKILSFFRLLALKDKSITLKLTARLFEFIMVKKYGDQYMEEAFHRYFPELDHPVSKIWLDIHGAILCK